MKPKFTALSTLDEIERVIRPILDRYKHAIDRSLKTGGITIVVGPDLHPQMRAMLAGLGWDGGRPVLRLSQARAMRIADAQLDVERTTGQPPDPIFGTWLRDRRAHRVWVHTSGANFICRSDGTRVTLVPGSTDAERAARGKPPVYILDPSEMPDPTDSINSPGGVA